MGPTKKTELTEAQKVNEAMLKVESYRDGSMMEAMRFVGDCQNRLRNEDWKKFEACLSKLQALSQKSGPRKCSDFGPIGVEAKGYLVGEPDLMARFDQFFGRTCAFVVDASTPASAATVSSGPASSPQSSSP